jgi:hypothetical protein
VPHPVWPEPRHPGSVASSADQHGHGRGRQPCVRRFHRDEHVARGGGRSGVHQVIGDRRADISRQPQDIGPVAFAMNGQLAGRQSMSANSAGPLRRRAPPAGPAQQDRVVPTADRATTVTAGQHRPDLLAARPLAGQVTTPTPASRDRTRPTRSERARPGARTVAATAARAASPCPTPYCSAVCSSPSRTR